MSPARSRARRFLFAVRDGGGNAGPELALARRLVTRGHEVHALGDPTLAAAAAAAGCSFSPWSRAPRKKSVPATEHDPLDAVLVVEDMIGLAPES